MKLLLEKWNDKVEIHYENLPVNNDEIDGYIDWTYRPFKDDVKDFLFKFTPENIQNSDSDEEIEKYLEDNFDDLFDAHIKEVEKEFRDDAIEDAEQNYSYNEEEAMWTKADEDRDYQIDMDIRKSTNESYEEGYDEVVEEYYVPLVYGMNKGHIASINIYKDKDDIYGWESDINFGNGYGFRSKESALSDMKETLRRDRLIIDFELLNKKNSTYKDAIELRNKIVKRYI